MPKYFTDPIFLRVLKRCVHNKEYTYRFSLTSFLQAKRFSMRLNFLGGFLAETDTCNIIDIQDKEAHYIVNKYYRGSHETGNNKSI